MGATALNQAQIRELDRYVRYCADVMGLRDWQINVLDERPEEPDTADPDKFQAIASMTPITGRRIGNFRMLEDLHEHPREEIRVTVAHELIHCHFAHLVETNRIGLLNLLGQQSYDIHMSHFVLITEHAIDAIAHAWAEFLPLIRWPDTKKKGGGK
jgi:hypothetical protein